MPIHLRALIVIIFLAVVVFAFTKAPACAVASTQHDFERRRNLWIAVTIIAFLAHNFWVYIASTTALLLFFLPRETNKLALFFFLLFAVPAIESQISGMGVINHFFSINYLRLLSLTILLPSYLSLRKQKNVTPFLRFLTDKFVFGYIILLFLLMLNASTFTNALRHGILYGFLDVFLPYYVASRSLQDLKQFRDALMAFVIASMILSLIGVFEFLKHWLLYINLDNALGSPWQGGYLERGDGNLRALASTGHAIALGYVIAVALGFFLFLKKSIPNNSPWFFGLSLLLAGLIAPLSRGPWLGAAAMMMVFIATGLYPLKKILKLSILGIIIFPILLATPFSETIINYLPFVGTVEVENITFRERLVELSIQVLIQNPWFGAFDYIYSPAFQELKTGSGFLDIVNTYVAVALSSGLIGLSFFSGAFLTASMSIFKVMRKLKDKEAEFYVLGQVLLAVLLGIMIIIFTVSSITVIPIIYWSTIGLGIAYTRMFSQIDHKN